MTPNIQINTDTHNRKRATEQLGCEMSCEAERILSCHMCSVYYSLINPQAVLDTHTHTKTQLSHLLLLVWIYII